MALDQDLVVAGLRAVTEINRQNNQTVRLQSARMTEVVETKKEKADYHNDAFIPGQKLDDYTTRTPTEDGLFVHVVQHKEWVEKIKQPPSEEEKQAARESQELALKKAKEQTKVAAILVGGVVALGVGLAYLDRKGTLTRAATKVSETV